MVLDDDELDFHVVKNAEEQYSIWPAHKPVPAGWSPTGFSGKRAACLAHIEAVWTDMRPLSLRQAVDGASAAPQG